MKPPTTTAVRQRRPRRPRCGARHLAVGKWCAQRAGRRWARGASLYTRHRRFRPFKKHRGGGRRPRRPRQPALVRAPGAARPRAYRANERAGRAGLPPWRLTPLPFALPPPVRLPPALRASDRHRDRAAAAGYTAAGGERGEGSAARRRRRPRRGQTSVGGGLGGRASAVASPASGASGQRGEHPGLGAALPGSVAGGRPDGRPRLSASFRAGGTPLVACGDLLDGVGTQKHRVRTRFRLGCARRA